MKWMYQVVLTAALLVVGTTAFAATITVDTALSTNAVDGACSLVEAVNNANNNVDASGGDCVAGESLPAIDVIEFAIAGTGPHTISVSNQIQLTEAVVIDGTTQPGTVCALEGGNRALQINIDGSGISSSGNIFDITNGADDVTIKGFALYGNNQGSGIATWANNTTVQCSNIGTDTEGLLAYPNVWGISVYNNGIIATEGHIFGGPNPGDGNLVSGNNLSGSGSVFDGQGISCGASNILIQGNWIGLDSTGQDIMPNKNAGIYCGNSGYQSLTYNNIQILDNVISGNGTQGDLSYASGINLGGAEDANTNGLMNNITIKGNIIGLSADGLIDLGNQNSGIFIGASTSNVVIGGLLDGEENIISGNGTEGLFIGYDTDTVSILGNIIGLAPDGVTRITNGSFGINLLGPNNGGGGSVTNISIGGSAGGAGNIISGNGSDGIYISNGLDTVSIKGNIIGPDSTGTTCVENSSNSAIVIGESANVTIGGDQVGERNIIGCALTTGIDSSGVGAVIEGNYIGVGFDGVTDIATQNTNDPQDIGIELRKSTTVGGDTVAKGNTIRYMESMGIKASGTTGSSLIQNNTITDNTIGVSIFGTMGNLNPLVTLLQNSITNNTEMGLDLGNDSDNDYAPDGVGATTQNINDVNDTDTGPNGYLNHPTVLMTLQDGSDMSVMYGLDVPTGYYRVEFFTNPTNGIAESGFGEGEVYEGYELITKSTLGFEVYTKVLTDASIDEDVTLTVTACDDALCTNYLGTSEFSNTAPPGVDYDATDYSASHVLNTIYLGQCVNGDNGSVSNADMNGPNQVGAYLGTGPCLDDRDGVLFVESGTVEGPSSYQTQYDDGGTGLPDDATFSGTYTGTTSNNQYYLVIASTSPDNGDDADYFIWVDDEQNISEPTKITPGIPQLIDHGIYVTFANGTGHQAFDFEQAQGQVWGILANTGGPVPSTTEYQGAYEYGDAISLAITASDPGYIHIWIDNNQDGDFTDADEWLVVNQQVVSGSNAATVYAPARAGTFTMRVRYQSVSDENMLPTGTVNDGEVEDYQFTVVAPTPVPVTIGTSTGYLPRLVFKPITNPGSQSSSSSSASSSPADILGSGTCPAELIIKDFMKQGDRNGKYSAYNKRVIKDVKILQAHINRILAAQYNQAAGPVDGIFGKLTKRGVERLQTALNTVLKPVPVLKIDGIVGPYTRDAINNSCGK